MAFHQEYRAKFPGITTTSIASLEAFYYTTDTIPYEGNSWQGTNRGGYSNPDADRLDQRYFTTIDPAERQRVLTSFEKGHRSEAETDSRLADLAGEIGTLQQERALLESRLSLTEALESRLARLISACGKTSGAFSRSS